MIGRSASIREILRLVDAVAASDCCVLIEGESGAGKELVARRVHAMSTRRRGPFVPVNCAGVTETLFESQFFGHVRGAFTGAEQTMLGLVRSADGGTLFMDEVGDMPLSIQPKLLRVLELGEVMPVGTVTPVNVDTRFIAATNSNLREQVRKGRFREDVFYRLNVVRIFIPPLRDRPEDIPVLLDHFLGKFAEKYHRPAIHVDKKVRHRLDAYSWPGNVRELVSWVERLYVTGLSPPELVANLLTEANEPADDVPTEVMSLRNLERWGILRAMKSTGNRQQEAARLLHIHRSTLSRKLKEFAIT